VKEKVLAAYRAGLREVILPKHNEKDLREIPAEVRKNMVFTFVETMDEVLRLAMLPAVAATPADMPPAKEPESDRERRGNDEERPLPPAPGD
jgi:ATP-dependent Lon protease